MYQPDETYASATVVMIKNFENYETHHLSDEHEGRLHKRVIKVPGLAIFAGYNLLIRISSLDAKYSFSYI